MVDSITRHAINNLKIKKKYFELVATKSFTATLPLIAPLFAEKKRHSHALYG
jgi:hypothetical protein